MGHPTSEQLQELYELEYKPGHDDYLYVLNGFREHADRLCEVMKTVKRFRPRRVLDVGCNKGLIGALCNWNSQPIDALVGVDISPTMARIAQQVHGYNMVAVQDASKSFELELRFDLVLCMELLEHVPDVATTIDNCLRHCDHFGRIIFTTPEERGELDGAIHVRHLGMKDLVEAVEDRVLVPHRTHTTFIASNFCEKPKWQGWNMVIIEKTT
jgi:2-polyprenyl-3-methyl-5-hydroxy-6-metoxy-1,4-benzoquinol methylase